jgi:retron-type reverse transcriptase
MQRLGYWKEDAQPTLATSLIKRRGELQRQINALSAQITDPKAALKAIHQERMAAARQQRIDTKVKREVERYQCAQAWHEKQQNHIHYLGDAAGFKPSAPDDVSDEERLTSLSLPIFSTAAELAAGMGITLNELRFLTYSNQVSRVCHYQHFAMQKKSGGTRLISAPMPRLKRLQYWVLDNILQPLELTEQAHGFVTGRSIVSNAQPHLAQKVVINLDLKDFFPTVTYPRIKGTFAQLGYNHEVASLLALLCSEAETQTVEMDGQRYYLNSTSRRLPQGAPTSPALSNVICRTLDKRLQGLATKHGFAYTRYADDLTFSGEQTDAIPALLYGTKATVTAEGFNLHPDKTRIMKQGSKQEVTGIVVNQHLSLDNKKLKQFRALLFQIDKDGYEGKNWGNGYNLLASIKSYAHYVRMVNPAKGSQFLEQIAAIQQKHGKPHAAMKFTNTQFRERAAQGQLPLESMRVAPVKPQPTLEDTIQHRDVLPQVQAALGLQTPEIVDTASEAAPATPAQPQGLVSTLMSLLRGKS